MTKLDKYTYRVQPGETVTLTAKLQGLAGNMISVSKPMTREPGPGDPTFSFTVPTTGAAKVINVVAEVSFVQPPPGAKANISLEGSMGGGSFSIPAITASSAIKDPGFAFWVVASEDNS